MTTSTTDAEAIARIISRAMLDNPTDRKFSERVEVRKERARGYADEILSYLASRREAIANDDIADALERCDWSGAPIGNKAIIASAIERLRENVLFCEDAADHLALIDYISDKIGLPKDEELSREIFLAWLSASRREAQEPVAWRWRRTEEQYGHEFAYGWAYDEELDQAAKKYTNEIQPLYTAPPAPAGGVERLGPEETLSAEILAELTRARAKFPGKNVTFAALVEEVGELATATFEEGRDRVRKEAVQVAVMAMRMVLDGDHTFDDWRASKGLDCLVPAASTEGGSDE